MGLYWVFFFFSSRRRYTMWPRDWSSDVCSSDPGLGARTADRQTRVRVRRADIGQRTVDRPVRDRDLELRAARGDRPDDADHGRVLRVRAGVRRALRGIPASGLRGCVVAGLE